MVNALKAEDADVLGISFSTATYVHYTRDLLEKMKAAGVDDVPVMLGGLIHRDDEAELREIGVKGIFGPGSTTDQIVRFLEQITGKSLSAARDGLD
jgi:methylmalonyl-CoA mutase C-terminal domain/subunit